MDQFSGYTCVYLQHRIMSDDTVQAKHAFESVAEQQGVKISHYHADNGRFANNAFFADCNTLSGKACRIVASTSTSKME